MNISTQHLSVSLLSDTITHRVNLLIKVGFKSESIFKPAVFPNMFSLHLHISTPPTVSLFHTILYSFNLLLLYCANMVGFSSCIYILSFTLIMMSGLKYFK